MNNVQSSEAVDRYMNEVGSRLVAQTGRASDRYHIGKLILQGFKDAPEFILQIDGATAETETFKYSLKRTVQCANALRKMGLETHDTIVIMAPNHIHLTTPIYAGFYLGVAVAGVDITSKIVELEKSFKTVLPKVIFCQDVKAAEVHQALTNINHKAQIVIFDSVKKYTFDDSDNWLTLSLLLESGNDIPVEDFKASEFDSETTISILGATSGSTGLPKFVAASHKSFLSAAPSFLMLFSKFPTPFNTALLLSPVQWLTSHVVFSLSPIFRFSRLQFSLPITPERIGELIETYKPSYTVMSPSLITQVFNITKCDLTCFDAILIGGNAVPSTIMNNIQQAIPNTRVRDVYGLTEISGLAFNYTNSVPGSVGVAVNYLQYRLVNHETQENINEPNKPGELWLKGPAVFMGYYNNPEMTTDAKTCDGWLKTGDIFYRDENGNFFFVERLKLMMKYMNHQISPVEIEKVIMKHPGVLTVAVTKIPDERGDLPVACVVRKEGCDVTAQEIKDLVKGEYINEYEQLRGGVIFMKELPLTSTMKVNRNVLASMVLDMNSE